MKLVEREDKCNLFALEDIPHECMLMVYKDGRLPWKCDYCRKYQHPDHEITRSMYYQFSHGDGPNFCSFHCMMDYRGMNDVYRFSHENTNDRTEVKAGKNRRRDWNIKKRTVKSSDVAQTDKQRENTLQAVIPEESDDTN